MKPLRTKKNRYAAQNRIIIFSKRVVNTTDSDAVTCALCKRSVRFLKVHARERTRNLCAGARGRFFCERREFMQIERNKFEKTRSRETNGLVFVSADPVYAMEAQGSGARVQRRQALPLGEHAGPSGLPREIRRVYGGAQRLFLGSLGTVQKLHQGVSASTRAAEVAGTLTDDAHLYTLGTRVLATETDRLRRPWRVRQSVLIERAPTIIELRRGGKVVR